MTGKLNCDGERSRFLLSNGLFKLHHLNRWLNLIELSEKLKFVKSFLIFFFKNSFQIIFKWINMSFSIWIPCLNPYRIYLLWKTLVSNILNRKLFFLELVSILVVSYLITLMLITSSCLWLNFVDIPHQSSKQFNRIQNIICDRSICISCAFDHISDFSPKNGLFWPLRWPRMTSRCTWLDSEENFQQIHMHICILYAISEIFFQFETFFQSDRSLSGHPG